MDVKPVIGAGRDEAPRAARWVGFVERRHRGILLASLALTLASALSLFALRFDFDVLDMLPTGAPAFDSFKTFVAEFGELDRLLVLVDGDDPVSVRAFADMLVARVELLDSVENVQGKFDVASIEEQLLGRYLYNYLPVEAYAQLRERLSPAGIDVQVLIDRAMLQAPMDLSMARQLRRDPLGLRLLAATALQAAFSDASVNLAGGYLSTRDGTAVLLFVRPRRNAFDLPFTTRFMAQMRAAEAAARAAMPGAAVRVAYTGSYAFALEDAATLKWDVARYTVLALAGVLAIFYLGYRNLRILPFVTYPLIVGTLLTFAVSLLCYAQLNAVSLSFAAILYGLSIDSCIYYFTRLSQERQAGELRAAVTRTLAYLGPANVVASSTTAAVFFVIGFSRLAGVSQLGLLTAVGMLINIAEFFILYPALSFWMTRPSLMSRSLDTPRLGRLAAACASHARAVVWGSAGVTLGLVILAIRVPFDVDLTHLRPAASAAARVEAEIAARFGAEHTVGAVLVGAPTLEAALQGSEQIEARLRSYREERLVTTLRGITALLPSVRTQHERLALFAQLPREQAARELLAALDRHGFQSAQFADFVAEFTQPHAAVVQWQDPVFAPFAAVIARHVRQRDGRFMVATYVQPGEGVSLATVAERLRRDEPGLPFIMAGRSLLQEELARMLRRELVGFFLAAFALNAVLVALNFRRLGTVLAILVAPAIVIVCCLAAMDVTGIGIGPVNLIVVPLILGIGVDHCVYVAERRQRDTDAAAAGRHVGRAMAISGLTTVAGFGFLGMSRYPALADMGVFAAGSLLLCLIAAMTLFHALLTLLAPGGGR